MERCRFRQRRDSSRPCHLLLFPCDASPQRFVERIVIALTPLSALPAAPGSCFDWFMALIAALKRLLIALAVAGLVAGGFGAPPVGAAAAPFVIVDDDAVGMADNMPCCPDNAKPDCRNNCPLMVMCFAPGLPVRAEAFALADLRINPTVLMPRSDDPAAGLSGAPPRRPPRI